MLLSGGRVLWRSRRKQSRVGPTWSCTKAPTEKHLCVGRPHRGRGGTKSRSASPSPVRHSHLWDLGTPRVHRSPTSNSPYGTSSGWWVILPWRLGTVHEFTGKWGLPGGIQARSMGRRPMQAWVSCSWGRGGPQALGGAPCGEQSGHDIKRSGTNKRDLYDTAHEGHCLFFGSACVALRKW